MQNDFHWVDDSGAQMKLNEQDVILDFNSNLKEYNLTNKLAYISKPLTDQEKQKLYDALLKINEEDVQLEKSQPKGFLNKIRGFFF